MKKFYSLISAIVFTIGSINAQCVIDTAAQTTPGVNPTADNLPCIERGVAYNQTLQVKVQTSSDTTLTIVVPVAVHIVVDSARIDSVVGLPTGLAFSRTPDVIRGGSNGCGTISGTTNDAAGRYPLTAYGTAWLRGIVTSPIAFDTAIAFNGNLNRFSPFGDYYVDVINTGDACHASTGITNFSSSLNAALVVFPNPSTGIIQLNLNTGTRVNGDVNIIDATGRIVYNQKLDVVGSYNTSIDLSRFSKGLYTVQLRTTEGIATKNISVE